MSSAVSFTGVREPLDECVYVCVFVHVFMRMFMCYVRVCIISSVINGLVLK